MFYCDKCGLEKGWPKSITKSFGTCELCDEVSVCNDTPSRLLPSVGPKNERGELVE